jgi:methylated-DNA-[protein]-cysteine S-methyltransferase
MTISAEDAIVAVDWGWGRDQDPTPLLLRAKVWLQAYFDGEIRPMTLPLAPAGTPYRQRVWTAIRAIPAGTTWSYQAVAQAAGGSPRSVGGAMAANPLPLLIPCHRVVGRGPGGSATIGGYSGGEGIETKRFLLDLERRAASGSAAIRRADPLPGEQSCHNNENGVTR